MSFRTLRTETHTPFAFANNRGVATLSDDTMVVAFADNDDDGTIVLMHTVDRVNFTYAYDSINVNPRYFSFTVDADDAVHIAYGNLTGGEELRYRKLTKDVGEYTWTSGGTEVVHTAPTNRIHGRRDIEVLDSGVVVILTQYLNSNVSPKKPNVLMYVRHGGDWDLAWSVPEAILVQDDFLTMTCTVARDVAGASGGYQKIMMAYQIASSGPLLIQSARVKISDGTVDQVTTIKSVANVYGYIKTWGLLFSSGPNEWLFAGAMGLKNGTNGTTALAYKLSGTAVLAEATQFGTAGIGASLWDTLPTFAFMGTGSNGRLVVFTSRISGDSTRAGLYAKVARVIDNKITWGPSMVYQAGVGYEYSRAGANRNNGSRYADVVVSRKSDKKHHYLKLDAPAVPTGVLPGAGATVTSSRPVLSAVLPASQGRVRCQWQTALDTGFTASIKTTLEPEADLRDSGLTSEQVALANAVNQLDPWYLRAAAVSEFGIVGAYSTPTVFSVTHPPSATNMVPTGAQTVLLDVPFSWKFTDPYTDDSQTAYQIVIELNEDGTVLHDTGEIESTDQAVVINAGAPSIAQECRWKIRLRDQDEVWGAWSAYHIFNPYPALDLTITAPLGTVTNPAPDTSWTVDSTYGRTQRSFQVVITDTDGLVAYDSGKITSTDSSKSMSTGQLVNLKDYIVTLSITDSMGLVSTESAAFSTLWVPPPAPPYVIDTSDSFASGFVSIQWDDEAIDDEWSGWRVYRRLAGSTGPGEMLFDTSENLSEYLFVDWYAPLNSISEWCVVQVALRFGVEVESDKLWLQEYPDGEDYWLLHPSDPEKHVRLWHVTDDGFQDEYESEILQLIGRGRHEDRGTRWGYTGSLTADIRNRDGGKSAREQRLDVELVKAEGTVFFLRNPFGDIFQVSMGGLDFKRIAGVGAQEMLTLTVPYSQVV